MKISREMLDYLKAAATVNMPVTLDPSWVLELIKISAERWKSTADVLTMSIDELGLSVRSRNIVVGYLHIETVGELIENTPVNLLNTKGCGRTILRDIRQRLASLDLTLKHDHLVPNRPY